MLDLKDDKKIGMELEVITCKKEFKAYRYSWTKLLEAKNNTNPFIEYDWVFNWWKYLGDDKDVEIVVVKEGEEIIAFFPFYYRRNLFSYMYQFIGFGQANYMDIIVSERHLEKAVTMTFDHVMSRRGNVVFYLHGLLKSGNTASVIKKYLESQNTRFSVHRVVTPYIDLKQIKHEKYMKKRKRLHRLDRRQKRLYENGEVKITKSATDDLEYIFELHDKRWEKRQDTSGFTNPKERKFYTQLARTKDSSLKTEVDAIYFNEKMIAFNYAFSCRGRTLGYVLGYDDDFEVFSPGQLLEKEKIIQRKNENDDLFDLSIGYEPYKFDLNTGVDYTERMIFSSPSLVAKLIRKLVSTKERKIEILKSNYRIVLFKRNKIGHLLYVLRKLFKKDTHELWYKGKQLFRAGWRKIYENRQYIVYQIARDSVPESIGLNEFVELTLDEAMKHEVIGNHYLRSICEKIYGGYKGYYPKGNLTMDNIFWTNERVFRIDEIAYLEQFKKSSISITNWSANNILAICEVIKARSNARMVFVAIEKKETEKRIAIENAGFSELKYIAKKTLFGIDTYSSEPHNSYKF